MKITCIIPTYNEAENIRDLVNEILELRSDIEVLVVDDDSPDGTWKIVKEITEKNKRVHLLHRTKNKGRGYSGRAGFRWCLDNGADAVVEMDADFSHQPKYIPALINGLRNADMVLGSRRVKGGKDLREGTGRKILTFLANLYIRILLGVKVKDCNSGFKVYTRDALEKINVNKLFAQGPLTVQEILYRAKLAKLKIMEVPIEFIEREIGETKLDMNRILQGYFGVLKLRWMHLIGKI